MYFTNGADIPVTGSQRVTLFKIYYIFLLLLG